MKSTARVFRSIQEAEAANDEYYADLTPDQCLNVLAKLVALSKTRWARRELKIYEVVRTKRGRIIREGDRDFRILEALERDDQLIRSRRTKKAVAL